MSKKRKSTSKRRSAPKTVGLKAFIVRLRIEQADDAKDLLVWAFDPEALRLIPGLVESLRKPPRRVSPRERQMWLQSLVQVFQSAAQSASVPRSHVSPVEKAAVHEKLAAMGQDRCPICGEPIVKAPN